MPFCKSCQTANAFHELINDLCHRCTAKKLEQTEKEYQAAFQSHGDVMRTCNDLRAQLTAANERAEKVDGFREQAASELRRANEALSVSEAAILQLRADKEKAEKACYAKDRALIVVRDTCAAMVGAPKDSVLFVEAPKRLRDVANGAMADDCGKAHSSAKADLLEALGALAAALEVLEVHNNDDFCKRLKQTLLRLSGL